MFLWNSLAFLIIQLMLAIWSLVPLAFLKPAEHLVHVLLKPGLENFEHYLMCVRWVQLCGSLNILWHCLSSGLEWIVNFSSPVVTAEFSKFAGILIAAHQGFPVLCYLWVSSSSCPLKRWCYLTIFILCSSLLFLFSVFPRIRLFSNELALHIQKMLKLRHNCTHLTH